jgi:predicted metalloprotease
MRRVAALVALLAAIFVAPVAGYACTPHYEAGFAALHTLLGEQMGEATSCEFGDPNGSGDVHQQTSRGLAFWRKSTNTPTFTDGFQHWALTDEGPLYWTGSSIDPPGSGTIVAKPSSPQPAPAPAKRTEPAPQPKSPPRPNEAGLIALAQDVVSDANAFWAKSITRYQPAKLTWYRDVVTTPCGKAEEIGPFYCGINGTVYAESSLFESMWQNGLRSGIAVVLGHEVGHHVERHLGRQVAQLSARQTELSADCLGGVWAGDANRRGRLPAGGIAQARLVTSRSGDPEGTAASSPDSHGTGQQRLEAFNSGVAERDPRVCLKV